MVSLVSDNEKALRINGFEPSQVDMLWEIVTGDGLANEDWGFDILIV